MTVRAKETGNTLINDLLALRRAGRVVCRMTNEEIMACMQLGLHDDERSEYYEVDYDEILEEDACYAHLPLGVRPCEDGAELVTPGQGIPGLQLRIVTESFSYKGYEASVDACYCHNGEGEVFFLDEDEEVAANSEVAAAMRAARNNTYALPVIHGIADRFLEALF
jgi:hypothetical protein